MLPLPSLSRANRGSGGRRAEKKQRSSSRTRGDNGQIPRARDTHEGSPTRTPDTSPRPTPCPGRTATEPPRSTVHAVRV